MLAVILGPMGQEVTGGRRTLHNYKTYFIHFTAYYGDQGEEE
jgi:hypothetical protein